MSSKEIAVSVRGLSKAYTITRNSTRHTMMGEMLMHRLKNPFARAEKETFWALKEVNFEIHKGNVVGIIGRNGAGKSTLLKILSRITKPTTGQIDLYGRVGALLEVGTGFHAELTGRENIFLNGAILGMRKREIERQFDAIVSFAEVGQFLDTPVKRYSSGMYVRLAFAVAAHLNPEILIVDEVLAVGDAEFQKKCLGKMQDVAHSGRTVLFVSHNMSTVQQLCNEAILLRSGTVFLHDTVQNVVQEYVSDSKYSENGVFSFSDPNERMERMFRIIQSISVGSESNPQTSHFDPQDDLMVRLHLHSDKLINNPRIAVTIEDDLGRRITTLASYFGKHQIADIEGDSYVQCVLPHINLGTGRYLIGASVSDQHGRLLDSIDNAGWFQVGWRNSYGNGENYHSVFGPVLMSSTWQDIEQSQMHDVVEEASPGEKRG